METLVIVAWWIALILALVLTIIILPVIVRVLFALREIDRLAQTALPAARGIADNTATIAALDDVLAQAARLLRSVEAIGRVAAGIREKVASVGAALMGGRA
jgi:sensor histidine kinase regulating citrate/malate metabolism